jgi:hypothetical protein
MSCSHYHNAEDSLCLCNLNGAGILSLCPMELQLVNTQVVGAFRPLVLLLWVVARKRCEVSCLSWCARDVGLWTQLAAMRADASLSQVSFCQCTAYQGTKVLL